MFSQSKTFASFALAALAASLGCAKTPVNTSSAQDIVGVNANHQQAAMTLVAVRNRTTATLPNPGMNRALQLAVFAFERHFFALAECTGNTSATPSDMTALLDRLSKNDELFVNAQRQIVTNGTDALAKKVGVNAANGLALPCTLVGNQMLTWLDIEALEQAAGALPATAPTGTALAQARRVFLATQMLHLALRGPYSLDPKKEDLFKFDQLMTMIMESKLKDMTGTDVVSSMRAGDPFYNPCVSSDAKRFAYLNSWKSANFSCDKRTSDAAVSDYAPRSADDSWVAGAGSCDWPAGRDQLGYNGIKYMWTCQTDDLAAQIGQRFASHTADQRAAHAAQRQLWMLLSSTHPFVSEAGSASDLGTFLATGKAVNGFKYATYFATDATDSATQTATLALVDAAPVHTRAASLNTNASAGLGLLDTSNPLSFLTSILGGGSQLNIASFLPQIQQLIGSGAAFGATPQASGGGLGGLGAQGGGFGAPQGGSYGAGVPAGQAGAGQTPSTSRAGAAGGGGCEDYGAGGDSDTTGFSGGSDLGGGGDIGGGGDLGGSGDFGGGGE